MKTVHVAIGEVTDRRISLQWEPGFELEVCQRGNTIFLSGNRAGLISIASHLLTLAQPDVSTGTHIHLDESNSLEEGSLELVLEKVANNETPTG